MQSNVKALVLLRILLFNAQHRAAESRRQQCRRKAAKQIFKLAQELMLQAGEVAGGEEVTCEAVARAFGRDLRGELDTALRTIWRYQKVLRDMGVKINTPEETDL